MKYYYTKKSAANTWLTVAILGSIATLIQFFLLGRGAITLFASIMGFINYHSAKNNPLIKIEEDHLEIKVAALAPKKYIFFKEIKSIDETNPKETKILFNKENKEERAKISNIGLEADDLKEVIQIIKDKIYYSKQQTS